MGLYAAKWTNANSYYNIQFISNGGASYWFDGASENTIVGGFTGGEFPVRDSLSAVWGVSSHALTRMAPDLHQGNPWPTGSESFNIKDGDESFRQVIRGTTSYANVFLGVQAEPGQGQYFSFDNQSVQNSVFGVDNCPAGSVSEDPSFLTLGQGSVWGAANGPGQSATIGEGSNTISAHRLICGKLNATPSPGAFRGGVDLCEHAESLASTRAELAELREEVAQLRESNAELAAMLRRSLARPQQ